MLSLRARWMENFGLVGAFSVCRSICAGDEPDPSFHRITYAVYRAPAIPYVFGTGEIKNTNMVCDLVFEKVEPWVMARIDSRALGG